MALNDRLQKLCAAPAADPTPASVASTPRKESVDSQKWLADNVGEDWGKIERPASAMMSAELGGPAVELGAPTTDKRGGVFRWAHLDSRAPKPIEPWPLVRVRTWWHPPH